MTFTFLFLIIRINPIWSLGQATTTLSNCLVSSNITQHNQFLFFLTLLLLSLSLLLLLLLLFRFIGLLISRKNNKNKTQRTIMMRRRTIRDEDEQSRALYDLSALVLNLIRSPLTPLTFSDEVPAAPPTRRSGQISPAGFASLLLGISLALMLCGSVTFFIGFVLMPWVLGLVMLFYVAGIVSTISVFGRSILCYATASPSPPKDIPSWKLM